MRKEEKMMLLRFYADNIYVVPCYNVNYSKYNLKLIKCKEIDFGDNPLLNFKYRYMLVDLDSGIYVCCGKTLADLESRYHKIETRYETFIGELAYSSIVKRSQALFRKFLRDNHLDGKSFINYICNE